jgi:CPA1 family monovalent cation:H+ antiporter
MRVEIVLVALFLVATAVALAARWLKVPYTVALVVAGLALGASNTFQPPHLTKDLLYAVFLPGLLFEAAFHLEYGKFWKNKVSIASLAMPGLVVAIGLTTVLLTPTANALHFVNDFTYADGAVFAALLAATDPIAVVGLFKSLGAPKRLAILVEGESLLNDGTAVVLFTLILGAVTGGRFHLGHALLDFVRVVGMGLGIGLAVGYAVSKAHQRVEDPMIEITFTTIAAYGSFALAEHFHFSGVIATVAAGMLCGNYGAATGMSPSTRVAVESFWEYIAFALNSVVFLLIGFTVRLPQLLASWKAILVAWLAVTVGRGIVVYVTGKALQRTEEKVPDAWLAVLTWGGLRGGLSMVLALALPPTLHHRELIITLTFGAVIVSILVQGMTMGPLLKALKLVHARSERGQYEMERGAQQAATQALASLDVMAREAQAHPDVIATLRADYEALRDAAAARIADLHLKTSELQEEELHATWRTLLLGEKDTVLRMLRTGSISGDAAEHLLRDIDARLVALEDTLGDSSGH